MTTPPKSVLIVESDQPTRALYQRTLGKDYRVLTCGSASAALLLLHDEHVDAVVWEPNAPQFGSEPIVALGLALAERCIPLVVCSTLDERAARQPGAAAHLIKPVLPSTLRDVLGGLTRMSLPAGDP